MSKTYETKRKILDILYKKQSTLSEISKLLGLAPSTVSKHLKGLEASGAIELVDNPYIRKWKYYIITPEELVVNTPINRHFSYAYIRNRMVESKREL